MREIRGQVIRALTHHACVKLSAIRVLGLQSFGNFECLLLQSCLAVFLYLLLGPGLPGVPGDVC